MQLETTAGHRRARRRVLAGIVSAMALVAPVSAVSAAHSEIVGSVPLQTLSRFAFRDQQLAAAVHNVMTRLEKDFRR